MELYMVLDVAYPYRFGELTCKLRAFLTEFTSYASVTTICAFSVERWLAIWSVSIGKKWDGIEFFQFPIENQIILHTRSSHSSDHRRMGGGVRFRLAHVLR